MKTMEFMVDPPGYSNTYAAFEKSWACFYTRRNDPPPTLPVAVTN
jgi:hypothetical protein